MDAKIQDLIGKTMLSVVNNDNKEIIFTTTDGDKYRFYHEQDCCECVTVEDIIGELEDLVGTPIILAENTITRWTRLSDLNYLRNLKMDAREETSEKNPEGITKEDQESFLWTFYLFSTIKGSVTIRWYGESN